MDLTQVIIFRVLILHFLLQYHKFQVSDSIYLDSYILNILCQFC